MFCEEKGVLILVISITIAFSVLAASVIEVS